MVRSLCALLAALAAVSPATAVTIETYGRLPLQFEVNQGQTHKDVQFLSRGPGYGIYLTSREAVLVLARERTSLRIALVGARRQPRALGLDEMPGKANYFIGKQPANWRTNVPTYARVRYEQVYPGVDLVYYGNQRQLEYDFVLAPGADPKKIVLGFKGASKLEIDAQGDLILHAGGSALRQHKPVVYQEIDGKRQAIDARYVLKTGKRVGFRLAAYDTARPLVIDPVVLAYSTYLGGSNDEIATSIAVDARGNAYVTGYSYSTDFPTTPGASQSAFGGPATDVFVAKLDPAGSSLVYSTYLGGSGDDQGYSIAIDSAGQAYVTGLTRSSDWLTTAGAFQLALATGASENAFIAKLDSAGRLVYSTYLGGGFAEYGTGIAADAAGHAYVTGYAYSSDFPTTPGAFQTVFGGAASDAFVTKLDPTGSSLVYSTYVGGSLEEAGNGIAIDAGGNAWITGYVASTDFPTTPGAFQPARRSRGRYDAFVTKLNPSGSALVYSTYLGGTADSYAFALAVDHAGNAYVTGSTVALDFPTTRRAFQRAHAVESPSIYDAFVTKLDATGSSLVYSTYLGGSDFDMGVGIAVDGHGNAYVTGTTTSPDFPSTAGAFQRDYRGSQDGFVTKLNSSGRALMYSSLLGGTVFETIGGIAVDHARSAYVVGGTNSPDFPTTAGAFQPTLGGNASAMDAFITKIVAP